MSDLSVVVISVSVIVLCWAVVRINQKIDEAMHNPLLDQELRHLPDSPDEFGKKTRENAGTPSA